MCYVLENGAVILEWRVPERKDGAKRSTHDGPATKTKEFQSINNMKKVDGCGMECIRMEAGRMGWNGPPQSTFPFRMPHIHERRHFTISEHHSEIREQRFGLSDF